MKKCALLRYSHQQLVLIVGIVFEQQLLLSAH